jgi:hypothetical protein
MFISMETHKFRWEKVALDYYELKGICVFHTLHWIPNYTSSQTYTLLFMYLEKSISWGKKCIGLSMCFKHIHKYILNLIPIKKG